MDAAIRIEWTPKFAAINKLVPLTETRQRKCLVVVITDRYSRHTRVIPTVRIAAPLVATILLENWIIPFGASSAIMTVNSLQFVSKVFAALCALLGTGLVTTMKYHPQSNEQIERYSKTLVARLRHDIDEHQTD